MMIEMSMTIDNWILLCLYFSRERDRQFLCLLMKSIVAAVAQWPARAGQSSMNLSVPVTTVTAGDSIANIVILTIEHLLHNNLGHPDSSSSLLMTGAWVTTTSLILATNIPLIYFIVHQRYKTFLDKLIIFDCILCIVGIVIVILNKVIRYTVEDVNFCIKIFLPFLLNLCNRFLTLSIVIYRYVFVLHSSVVETRNQRRAFESLVVSLIIIPSLYFTGVSIYYRDNNFHYLGTYTS